MYDHNDTDEITSLTRNPFDLDTLLDELECDPSGDCEMQTTEGDVSFASIFESEMGLFKTQSHPARVRALTNFV